LTWVQILPPVYANRKTQDLIKTLRLSLHGHVPLFLSHFLIEKQHYGNVVAVTNWNARKRIFMSKKAV